MNYSLIQTPIIGARTLFAKFVVPVRNAKTVPSILAGVILANRASVGKVFIAREITPKIVSVMIIKNMSFIPKLLFQRLANAYWQKEEIMLTIVDQYSTVLTSMSFK